MSVDGKLLNEELVRAGYAWVYKRYCKKSICSEWLDLESQARSSAIGLWADPNPQAPWKWRAGCKDDKSSTATSGILHGNVKSKVFHQSDCKYYDCKNCTAEFSSRKDALQNGYKSCGLCKP